MNLQDYLWVSDEVKEAVEHNKPVVALESTIISHGMPYPQNVETALAVETVIRENGAIPATIAILGGKMCVGISKEQRQFKALDRLHLPEPDAAEAVRPWRNTCAGRTAFCW